VFVSLAMLTQALSKLCAQGMGRQSCHTNTPAVRIAPVCSGVLRAHQAAVCIVGPLQIWSFKHD
jgi:hypothetical protein